MGAIATAHNHHMLTEFSNQLADVAAAVAPSVVQVQGKRWRTASGVIYAAGVVVTTIKALGREDGLHVCGEDARALDAELVAWDPATGLAVLQTPGLAAPPIAVATQPARVGHVALERGALDLLDRQRREEQRVAAERLPVGGEHRAAVPLDREGTVAVAGAVT